MADAWINLQALARKYGKNRSSVYYWIQRLPETDKRKIVVDRDGGRVCKIYVREKAADKLFKDPRFLNWKSEKFRKKHIKTVHVGFRIPQDIEEELKRLVAEKKCGTITQLIRDLVTNFVKENQHD